MNAFRVNGTWDRKYLRVCAVYRLLKRKKIGKQKAIELLSAVHSPIEMQSLRGTLSLWERHSIKDMLT